VFPLLQSSLPPMPRSRTHPGAPLLSFGELYERRLLELSEKQWRAFEEQRFRHNGAPSSTGDPVVDQWEAALKADPDAGWSRYVKENLGIHGG